MTSNETLDSSSTLIYYSSGDNVYYKGTVKVSTTDEDGNATTTDKTVDWTGVDLDCSTILSLGVTSDYLLAGTSSGIVHTSLSNGIPATNASTDFSTNADSALSSYYEISLILVIDSGKTEAGTTIFATAETQKSSASMNNVGLWGYYASENEWNRE